LIGSDIRAMPGVAVAADFRALPYADATFDVVVLDPPYVHTGPGHHYLDHRYGNTATTPTHSHKDIVALYAAGMAEAHGVLKRGGILMVKTMDEIESGKQHRTHIEIKDIAAQLHFKDRDFMLLVPPPIKTRRWRVQHHAHKSHSYLWIFERQ
jgi:methylase of polypeptide subunit release factors